MLEFLQTIRFVQNFFVFLYKLTRQLSRRKETAKSAENFLVIWTANICQRYDIRTPIDGIRGMVEISRHYAENAVDHLSADGIFILAGTRILILVAQIFQVYKY